MTRWSFLVAAAVLLPAGITSAEESEEEEEEVKYPVWGWGGHVSAAGGYDDNISVSSIFRPSEKQGSGTTEISGKIGPELTVSELFSLELTYRFDQTLYYSNSDIDGQTHTLALAGTLSHDRVEATIGYAFGVDALIPKGSLYSFDHKPYATIEVLLKKPLYVGAEYTARYYDIRDSDYAYLNGHRHTIDLYPEIYLARKLTLYGGYRLELLRVGSTVELIEGPLGGTTQFSAPQSYNGHYFFLDVTWKPIPRLSLGLSGRIGRRLFTDPLSVSGSLGSGGAGPGPGGQGPGGANITRADTVATIEPSVSWNFWDGLSAQAFFFYEKSASSVSTRRTLSSSYDNLAGSAGLKWEF